MVMVAPTRQLLVTKRTTRLSRMRTTTSPSITIWRWPHTRQKDNRCCNNTICLMPPTPKNIASGTTISTLRISKHEIWLMTSTTSGMPIRRCTPMLQICNSLKTRKSVTTYTTCIALLLTSMKTHTQKSGTTGNSLLIARIRWLVCKATTIGTPKT